MFYNEIMREIKELLRKTIKQITIYISRMTSQFEMLLNSYLVVAKPNKGKKGKQTSVST